MDRWDILAVVGYLLIVTGVAFAVSIPSALITAGVGILIAYVIRELDNGTVAPGARKSESQDPDRGND